MTREEAIEILWQYDVNFEPHPAEKVMHAIDMAIEALSSDTVSRVDCTDFLYWLIDEVMDEDNWELNAVADGEIICRKLKKLGLLESKDGYYHDISRATEESLRNAYYDGFNTASVEAQNVLTDSVSVVRCKDCRWYDNRYGDVCHNPRYGDGHANYQPPYVDEDYWCKDGERKGGGEK